MSEQAIQERLRANANPNCPEGIGMAWELMDQAADRIDALEKALQEFDWAMRGGGSRAALLVALEVARSALLPTNEEQNALGSSMK